MAIYFGSTGFIELKRDALNSQIATSLNAADVNTSKKRFSVENISGSLITGDQVENYCLVIVSLIYVSISILMIWVVLSCIIILQRH